MANERGKHIDNTHLSIDQAEARGFIHRDYIAHCLRWTHVAKHLQGGQKYKTAHILDIGCGKEVPLAKLLYSSRLIPDTGSYTGLDYNKLAVPAMFHTGKFPITLHGGQTFPDTSGEILHGRAFDVVTCFEVLEHVEPAQVVKMLREIAGHLAPGGRAFLSSPCYDARVGAAANHVNEMSYQGFGALIGHCGLSVHDVFGTFASIRDYQDIIKDLGYDGMFNRLREYYDVNYLATVFAPLFPDRARNCLWVVGNDRPEQPRFTGDIKACADASHSSSAAWSEFVKGL
jgi:2-polyprenyl-3-methyl-5-hydroxy-6-metoxy-1,4-benzoquinol methylase